MTRRRRGAKLTHPPVESVSFTGRGGAIGHARADEYRMRPYEEQLARVDRFLARISTPSSNRDDYEDFLWAFFQNCWHLRDWIRYDSSIPQKTRHAVSAEVEKSEVLLTCQCLANRSKHYELNRPSRRDARMLGGISLRIEDGATNGEPDSATISLDYVLARNKGASRRALTVAKAAVRKWRRILAQNGL